MIDWAVGHVPVKYRADIFTYLFIGLAFGIGFATNMLYRTHYVTQIVHTHPGVSQILGKPTQSVDCAQVNAQLAGLTCDIYANGSVLQAVYAHR